MVRFGQPSERAIWLATAGLVAAGLSQEAQGMRCVVCRQDRTRPGAATLVLERDGLTLVLEKVPAEFETITAPSGAAAQQPLMAMAIDCP